MNLGPPKRPTNNRDWQAWCDYEAALIAWDSQPGEPLEYTPLEIRHVEHIPTLRHEAFAWWDGVDWRKCRCPLRGDHHLVLLADMDSLTLWGHYRHVEAAWHAADEYKAFRAALNLWRVEQFLTAIKRRNEREASKSIADGRGSWRVATG